METVIPYKMVRLNADMLTPIGIFHALQGKKKFLLESTFLHEEKGAYSFIGMDPYQELICRGTEGVIIDYEKSTQTIKRGNLQSILNACMPPIDLSLPFPFYGGAIGYIGYDAARVYYQVGAPLQDDLDMPDVDLMFYHTSIVFDHHDDSVYLITMNLDNQPEHVLDIRLQNLEQTIIGGVTHAVTTAADDIYFEPEMNKADFLNRIQQAKNYIEKENAVEQIVLSQRLSADFTGDPFAFYRKLRKKNPSPYMFYIDFESYVVLGASPESLVEVADTHVITNPIAGTRPRGESIDEDLKLTEELLADQKEISEHLMLIESSKRDLQRICDANRITVPIHMKIEKYEHVMHIVSQVHGKLSPGFTSIDALLACLPAGTVSGSPRERAMQIINELEEQKRGVYGGGIGYINVNHDLNMALAIRSLLIKGEKAYLQAGAGIVKDSKPENEFHETMHKAKSIMQVAAYDVASI